MCVLLRVEATPIRERVSQTRELVIARHDAAADGLPLAVDAAARRPLELVQRGVQEEHRKVRRELGELERA